MTFCAPRKRKIFNFFSTTCSIQHLISCSRMAQYLTMPVWSPEKSHCSFPCMRTIHRHKRKRWERGNCFEKQLSEIQKCVKTRKKACSLDWKASQSRFLEQQKKTLVFNLSYIRVTFKSNSECFEICIKFHWWDGGNKGEIFLLQTWGKFWNVSRWLWKVGFFHANKIVENFITRF